MKPLTAELTNLFHEKNANETGMVKNEYGYSCMPMEFYVPELKQNVFVFFYHREDKRAGYYCGFEKRIYVNLFYKPSCVYEIICHEYWHYLQDLNGYPWANQATPEEVAYYNATKDKWEPGNYLVKDPCEMGAELFCALLGFKQDYFLSVSKDTRTLLKVFFKYVVCKNPIYMGEWKRINKKESLFHKPLDYKNGFK